MSRITLLELGGAEQREVLCASDGSPAPRTGIVDLHDAQRSLTSRPNPRGRAFVLRLSFPPPLSQRHRRVAGIGRVKSARYRHWILASRARLSGSSARRIGGRVSVELMFPSTSGLSTVAGAITPVMQFLSANGLVDEERSIERLSIKRLGSSGGEELHIQVRGL